VVKRTDNLPLLDPTVPQRAAGVRASAEQGMEHPSIVEDRDRQAFCLYRTPPSLTDVLDPTNRDEPRHFAPHEKIKSCSPRAGLLGSRTKNLGLASGESASVQFTQSNRELGTTLVRVVSDGATPIAGSSRVPDARYRLARDPLAFCAERERRRSHRQEAARLEIERVLREAENLIILITEPFHEEIQNQL
jgi:hypothetical protein